MGCFRIWVVGKGRRRFWGFFDFMDFGFLELMGFENRKG